MSGIAAVVRRDGAPVPREAADRLTAALAAGGSGGPATGWSEEGAFLVGVPRGPGPGPFLARGRSGLTLLLDGRLDNGPDLRRDLAQAGEELAGGTDGEVTLAVLERWGPWAGAARLLGDFAFLLWNPRDRVLTAGRDAMGMRALFLHESPHRFAFASRPRVLLDGAGVPALPNEGVAAEILAGHLVTRDATGIRDVGRVPPGCLVSVQEGGMRSVPFRALDPRRAGMPAEEAEFGERFLEVLREAVRVRLRGSTPLALSLSGGLDSATVAFLAGDLLRRGGCGGSGLVALTASFEGLPCDETERARRIAGACGLEHEVRPSEIPTREALRASCFRTGVPPESAPALSLAANGRRIRNAGWEAVLDGEGGDEAFAGSPHLVADLLERGTVAAAWREARAWSGAGPLSTFRVLGNAGLRPFVPGAVRALLRRLRPATRPPPWVSGDLAFRTSLSDRLRVEPPVRGTGGRAAADRLGGYVSGFSLATYEGMAWRAEDGGAEVRHPFLDLRVVEAALAIPSRWLASDHPPKGVLRHALEGKVPPPVLEGRDKAEYSRVCFEALRKEGTLKNPAFPRLASAGWIEEGTVRGLAEGLEAGVCSGKAAYLRGLRVLWTCLGLEVWLETLRSGSGGTRPAEPIPRSSVPPLAVG